MDGEDRVDPALMLSPITPRRRASSNVTTPSGSTSTNFTTTNVGRPAITPSASSNARSTSSSAISGKVGRPQNAKKEFQARIWLAVRFPYPYILSMS